MSASLAVATLLADTPTGKAGPVGLFMIVVLGVACYFLFRSMSRHLKRVPASFDEPAASVDPARAERRGQHPADPPAGENRPPAPRSAQE